MGNTESERWNRIETPSQPRGGGIVERTGSMGDASSEGLSTCQQQNLRGQGGGHEGGTAQQSGPTSGFWANPDWLWCRDGKFRPVEAGTFPLAPRNPGDVGKLRAYGNSLNAEAAIAFITSFLEAEAAGFDRLGSSSMTVEDLLS